MFPSGRELPAHTERDKWTQGTGFDQKSTLQIVSMSLEIGRLYGKYKEKWEYLLSSGVLFWVTCTVAVKLVEFEVSERKHPKQNFSGRDNFKLTEVDDMHLGFKVRPKVER